MAINKNSNMYTIIYTVVMVVIVGALLAFLATSLKGRQDDNVRNDQKFSIMKAFGAANDKSDKVKTINLFKENVTIGEVNVVKVDDEVTATANWLDRESATYDKDEDKIFTILGDRKKLDKLDNNFPIFKYVNAKGENLYVLPMTGSGLWDDIWGYVAINEELKISGIVMDHKGETPGLGAEIATKKVQDKFIDKVLFEDDENGNPILAVKMVKGLSANEAKKDPSNVDAITGGTKTCDGVNNMLKASIKKYEKFLLSIEKEAANDVKGNTDNNETVEENGNGTTEESTIVEPTNNVEE
jgi:Na+-transporting NADH:ubiquinone oxidoreductase subunit C